MGRKFNSTDWVVVNGPVEVEKHVKFDYFSEATFLWERDLAGFVIQKTEEGVKIRSEGIIYHVPIEQAKRVESKIDLLIQTVKSLARIADMDQILGGTAFAQEIMTSMQTEARQMLSSLDHDYVKRTVMS